jgi:hypothetical protein
MKLIYKVLVLFSISIFLYACQPNPEKKPLIEFITDSNSEAVGPYFTKDNKGSPVLCWTELNNEDSLYRLKYAIYDTHSRSFGEPITVSGSEGSSTAAESMGKVAFKSDGTIIALFNKRFENSKSRFASAIYYTLSVDKGKSWTDPQFIHSETSQDYGRSFFSTATLADGEVATIWLDGRFGEAEKGSALFFARTENGKGFGEDICLDKNTCECCRTEILNDQEGGIHIAYRGIQLPLDHLGKQVRDMVYSFSSDNGKTFTPTKVINKDNWEIEACPHTGPTLAYSKDEINALWFTGGGLPGLYFSSLKGDDQEFGAKVDISKIGRHPQMLSLEDGNLAVVWDEVIRKEEKVGEKPKDHDHASMGMQVGSANSPSEGSRIVLALLKNGKISRQFPISGESKIAHHPVIISLGNGVLAAWVSEEDGRPIIAYSFIQIN